MNCVNYYVSYNKQLNLQEYDGRLSFETDAWTSPNHYACVAVSVLLEVKGVPISIVLDVVEVPTVRSSSSSVPLDIILMTWNRRHTQASTWLLHLQASYENSVLNIR